MGGGNSLLGSRDLTRISLFLGGGEVKRRKTFSENHPLGKDFPVEYINRKGTSEGGELAGRVARLKVNQGKLHLLPLAGGEEDRATGKKGFYEGEIS